MKNNFITVKVEFRESSNTLQQGRYNKIIKVGNTVCFENTVVKACRMQLDINDIADIEKHTEATGEIKLRLLLKSRVIVYITGL